jgi:hypothetical protein
MAKGRYSSYYQKEKDFYTTTFCNKPHRLTTGRPIGHECYILDPKKLGVEYLGGVSRIQGSIIKQPPRIVRGRR